MKLLIILLLLPLFTLAQKHKSYRDTTFYSHVQDTVYGTVEYRVDGGLVTGKSILVTSTSVKWNDRIYKHRAVGLGVEVFRNTNCFIKTSKGWKYIDVPYKFSP